MSDILNIGRSGLLTMQAALEVTGENIANVDTPGYHRREVLTDELLPSGGVEVTDVRRAFDTLLAARQREAVGAQGAASAYLSHLNALEEHLAPTSGGIAASLDSFFDALDALVQTPDDAGLQEALLGAGSAFAARVNDLSARLAAQSNGIEAERGVAVTEANALLDGLAEIENELARFPEGAERNPLLDRRDATLIELSRLFPIHVSIDDAGRSTVRLGSDANGPILSERGESGRLELADGGRITLRPADRDAPDVTLRPASGVLGGLADAGDVLATAQDDFDAWAGTIAEEVNALHATGITADGRAGGPVFSAAGWDAEAGALTRGNAYADVMITDIDAMPKGPITLIHDATAGLWRAEDGAGSVLSEGVDSLSLPGFSISISGTPLNGDRITLTRQDPDAGSFRMTLADSADIAAGAPFIVSAAPSNSGSGVLSVESLSGGQAGSDILDLSGAFLAGEPLEFVSGGVVGVIPSGTESAVLSARPQLPAMDFTWQDGATGTALSFTRGADSYSFSAPSAMSAEDFVAALNQGTLTAAGGETLTELGLVAEASDGTVTLLAREAALPDAASVTTSAGTATGIEVASGASASDLAIFTRDGRQLSGPLLSPAEAAALLTPENGFDPTAAYNTSLLGAGLGGPSLDRATGAGDFALTLGDPPVGGLTTWPTGTVAPQAPARALSVDTATGPVDVAIPAGASAAWTATLLEETAPLSATAQTRLSLDLPASGTLTFDVVGSNTTPASISADLSLDGPSALAAAINAQAPLTGVRAETSSDGARLHLFHDGGADVVLSAVVHDGGDDLDVTRLDPAGSALGSATLTSGGGDSLRISGTVTLEGAESFSVLEGTTSIAAVSDPFTNGLIDAQSQAAGSVLVLRPEAPADDDLALRDISITGADGRVRDAQGDPALASMQTLAEGLAESLRAASPASRIEGAALGALPPDGARMVVSLGEQDYTVTMENGAPVVDGPEPGRLTASFDASNRLVIETEGGHLDGAALRLTDAAGDAALFGMGVSHGPVTTVIGQPFDAGSLPASFTVTIGGTNHAVTVSTGGIVLPPTFPGTGYINTAYGRVEIQFDARAGDFRVPAQADAADAGFDTMGLTADIVDGALQLTATDGQMVLATSSGTADGTTLQLTDMPNEDLLVVLSGGGGLRLAGDITEGPTAPRAQEVRLLDAEAGLVGLFDAESGSALGTRTLDAAGTAQFGDLALTLQGSLADGDVFTIAPNTGSPGDARTLSDIAGLRLSDPLTGTGGFGTSYATLQQRAGAQVATGEIRLSAADAAVESADRAVSDISGVDLDAEAARIIELQQAYQANAQVIGVGREIFDTLLQAL